MFGSNLTSGHTQSCGCYISEITSKRNTVHGLRRTRIYGIWRKIKDRCQNPNIKFYDRYGGRGIKLCTEWEDFTAFYDWAMTNGYADNLSIDRVDNDGDYAPYNCRWVTQKRQNNNTAANVNYTVNGEQKTQREWEERLGLPRGKLWKIKSKGESVEAFIQARLEG